MLIKAAQKAEGFSVSKRYTIFLDLAVHSVWETLILLRAVGKHLDNVRGTSHTHDGGKTQMHAQLHEHAFQVVADDFP